jgi:hypothetical protein
MASLKTITSANSVFTLVVPGLFQTPQQLLGYAVDKAFASEALTIAETQIGVDGRMTGGFTPAITNMTISLQADSPSRSLFTTMTQAMKTTREIFYITGEIVLPSTGEKFSLIRGILVSTKQLPDAQKVLQPVDYTIHWESVNVSIL